jgi:hypothetical protein
LDRVRRVVGARVEQADLADAADAAEVLAELLADALDLLAQLW